MHASRFRSALIPSILLCLAGAARSAWGGGWFDGREYPIVTDANFPADEFILSQARFWYEVYTNVGEDEGLLHDPFNPELVFRKVHVGVTPGKAGRKAVEAEVKGLQAEIKAISTKDTAAMTPKERELRARFPANWDSTALQLCAERLRFQRGLKNKFREGLERSFRYLPLVDSVFAAKGLPTRLKYLPHVESSFYPHAYSKVGAAGMWQFMKSSARHFAMKVGYLVDERRDPVTSTAAAANMLASNFALLQSWPLAIVAYNHGPEGVANAVRGTHTRDLGLIIKSYYSNSFGFASKNFYAEFLAASSIALKADSLFPDLHKLDPLRYQSLTLGKACGTRALCNLTGLTPEELEEYNLGLRPATFRGNTQLPKGLVVKLPVALDLAAVIGKLSAGEAVAAARPAIPASVALAPASAPKAQVAVAGTELPVDLASAKSKRKEKAKTEKAERHVAVAVQPRVGAKDSETAREDAALRPSGPVAAAPAGAASPINAMAPTAHAPAAPANATALGAALAASRKDTATMARALIAARSQPAAAPSAPPAATPIVIDSAFALQASDLDKLAHPMDRFNPAIYHLENSYADGVLTIQAGTEETLSHYADWAGIPERSLRAANHIRSKGLRIGQAVHIRLPQDKVAEFVRKREEYYRGMEEDFYGSYYVSALEPLRVEKGMNLWSWAQEKEIPFWLLQKHNPGKVLGELQPGDSLNVPLIETGIRKWGFTRYGNSKEYLAGISRYLFAGNEAGVKN